MSGILAMPPALLAAVLAHAVARPAFHARDNRRGFHHAVIDEVDARAEVAARDLREDFGDHWIEFPATHLEAR